MWISYGEEIIAFDRSRIIKQAKFTCSPLGKSFQIQRKTIEITSEKQRKRIGDAAKKQIMTLETLNTDKELKSFGSLFQKDVLTIETREWVEKTKKMEQEINRDDLIYKTGNKKKE